MKPLLGLLLLGTTALLLFTVLAVVVVTALAPLALRNARALPAAVAASRLRWLLGLPLAAGVILTAASFSPSVAASLFDHHHHCATHDGHPHLCLVHLPADAGPLGGWLLITLIAAFVVSRVHPLIVEVRKARRLVAALDLPRLPTDAGARVLDSAEPLCAAIGWLSPSVVVSRGFLSHVAGEHADAALAHERAHARRRDAWWAFVARLCAVVLPSSVGKRVLHELELATERACDEEAALAVGDRLAVASAIVAGERLALRPFGLVAASFGGAAARVRVRALLDTPPPPPKSWRRWDVRAALVITAAFASAGFLHHAAETVIGLAAH